MRALLTGLFLCLCVVAFAQQKPYTVKRDTINIHGYIYDSFGKGVNFIYVESTQLETEHNTFKLGAFTNDRGYFELKGAKFNDTLTVGPDIHYGKLQFYNKGSRLLLIYLPLAKPIDLTAAAPVVIAQKRKYPVVTPSFTVTPMENIASTQNTISNAKFPGGNDKLAQYIQQNLQYPEEALKKNMEGLVQISFTVTKDGYLKDFKILSGVSPECDEEALRVLKKIPKWEPALDHDQPVAIQEMVAIEFKLTDN